MIGAGSAPLPAPGKRTMKNINDQLTPLLTSFAEYMSRPGETTTSLLLPSQWNVATGTAGWVLFFHQMASRFPTIEWKTLAEWYLALTMFLLGAEEGVSVIPLGLFTGLAGICQTLAHLAACHIEYQPLHEQCATLFFQQAFEQYRAPLF
jgi:hypothetical protein